MGETKHLDGFPGKKASEGRAHILLMNVRSLSFFFWKFSAEDDRGGDDGMAEAEKGIVEAKAEMTEAEAGMVEADAGVVEAEPQNQG